MFEDLFSIKDTFFSLISSNLNLIISAFIVVIVPIIIYQVIHMIVNKLEEHTGYELSYKTTIFKLLKYLLVIYILFSLLYVFGVDISNLFLSIGFVTIVATIAAKDILSNILAGLYITLDQKFVVGDMIEIDNQMGVVTAIGLRNVSLYKKNAYMTIPNVLFLNKSFVNYTKDDSYAIKFPLKILNKNNLNDVLSRIDDILSKNNLILKNPHYKIFVTKVDTYGVEIEVKVFIKDYLKDSEIKTELIKELHSKIEFEDLS